MEAEVVVPMSDETTWWSDTVGPARWMRNDPWTSVVPYHPWMKELHRPGFRREETQSPSVTPITRHTISLTQAKGTLPP